MATPAAIIQTRPRSATPLTCTTPSPRPAPFSRAAGRSSWPTPDSYVGNYEFQVPIFVLTHHSPSVAPKHDQHLTFTFITDGVESAVVQAEAAARSKGDKGKAVQVVGGVNLAQQLLAANLADELHIGIMPVFLGTGLRAFDRPTLARLRLEKMQVREVAARTSLGFRTNH
jgi:dihydrofolate reductase